MLTQEEKKKIIYNAINSAICIDDQYPSPYSDIAGNGFDAASKLYSSFRKEGKCALDIFRYEGFENFLANKEHLLNNKELMILDWELCPNSIPLYGDTLKILEEAVNNKHVRCVSIYTQNSDYTDILLKIYSYFALNLSFEDFRKRIKKSLDDFQNELDDSDDEELYEKFIGLIKDSASGFILNDRKTETVAKLKEDILALKIGVYKISNIIKTLVKEIFKENVRDILQDGLKLLLPLYNIYYSQVKSSIPVRQHEKKYFVKAYGGKYLLIDNTIIFVLSKHNCKPDAVYNEVSNALSDIPNKRVLLLSLMLKNVLSENLAVNGNGFGQITESMLLHKWNSYEEEDIDNLIDFVILSIKEEIAESIRTNIDYEKIKQLFKIEDGEKVEDINNKELALFNKIITFTDKNQLPNKTQHHLKTGDIFKITSGLYTKNNNEYLICVSQSCDCLNAKSKLHSNFAFAYGNDAEDNMEIVLQNVENLDKYSIISEDKYVRWTDKFLTIHLENYKFDISDKLTLKIEDKNKELEYLGNLKDFYAQRIVNKIFKHALRIGVDLPKLKDGENNNNK